MANAGNKDSNGSQVRNNRREKAMRQRESLRPAAAADAAAQALTCIASRNAQFFITFDRCPWLDKKHTIFGKARNAGHHLRQPLPLTQLDPPLPSTRARTHARVRSSSCREHHASSPETPSRRACATNLSRAAASRVGAASLGLGMEQVTGNSVYNLMKMNEMPTADGDRPVDPPSILKTEVRGHTPTDTAERAHALFSRGPPRLDAVPRSLCLTALLTLIVLSVISISVSCGTDHFRVFGNPKPRRLCGTRSTTLCPGTARSRKTLCSSTAPTTRRGARRRRIWCVVVALRFLLLLRFLL